MRVSTVRDDPGYVDWFEASTIAIYLNSRKQSPENNGRLVITADDDAGMILYYRVKKNTNGLVIDHLDGKYVEHYAYGRVQIVRGGPNAELCEWLRCPSS